MNNMRSAGSILVFPTWANRFLLFHSTAPSLKKKDDEIDVFCGNWQQKVYIVAFTGTSFASYRDRLTWGGYNKQLMQRIGRRQVEKSHCTLMSIYCTLLFPSSL